MSHQQRRPPVPYQLRNEIERKYMQRLCDIRSHIPLNVEAVFRFIFDLKKDAESYLKNNHLHESLSCYNVALMAADLCPMCPPIANEHHKLLGNRSLVFLRMRQFTKAYWRASQAVKGAKNQGAKRALTYLVDGLREVRNGHGNEQDCIVFIVEICTLIIKVPVKDPDMLFLLNECLQPPDEKDRIWTKIIEKLAAQKTWEGVALLLNVYDDVIQCALKNLDTSTWSCESISVGTMLTDLSDYKLKAFGETLAITLLAKGADADEIGDRYGCPTLHYIVRLALRTGTIRLLSWILENYQTSSLQRNTADKDGCTVLHALVQMSTLKPSQHTEKVLDILLKNKCDASIMDKRNKKPIDYVVDKKSILYQKLFPVSTKSVDDLRRDLEVLKTQGNEALKSGNHKEALEMYDAALKVSQQSKDLYKEAAILYSNRANVHCTLKQYGEALPNAMAAITCDPNYPKGYLWKARALQYMGTLPDAFTAYLDGVNNTDLPIDHRHVFLTDACTILKDLPGDGVVVCCRQLGMLELTVWPQILGRLCKNGEWKCMAYLMLGPVLDSRRFGNKITVGMIDGLLSGVANDFRPTAIQTSTITTYLKDCDPITDAPWLDAILCVIIYRGNKLTWKNLAADANDCALHAATRFCLQTKRTSLLEHFVSPEWITENGGRNKCRDTVFHCIAKHRPLPDTDILLEVTVILVNRGLSIGGRDANGKLAVEYLHTDYPGEVFDLYFKTEPSVIDINKLKETGNARFRSGQILEALELYRRAIDTYEDSKTELQEQFTDHEVAILYGNRAEAFLSIKRYDLAQRDAIKSVNYDGHWHKAHMRVGNCLQAIGQLRDALSAYCNAYGIVESYSEDKIKVEIIIQIATVWACFPASRERIRSLPTNQGHIWLKACYQLVGKGDWNTAAVAYLHFSMDDSKRVFLDYSLKPLCDTKHLCDHNWALDAMVAFMEHGCDRRSLSLTKNDVYTHVVIKMTLHFAQNLNLLKFIIQCSVDHLDVDRQGNTLLHVTTREQAVNIMKRFEVLELLLQCGVNPSQKNYDQHMAIEYISPYDERDSYYLLDSAMRSKDHKKKSQKPQFRKSKQKLENAPSKKPQPVESSKKGCDLCYDLYTRGKNKLNAGEIEEGYDKMVELANQNHKGRRHESIMNKAVSAIAGKLSETSHPKIPTCLTSIRRGVYLMIVDRLAQSKKWRQLGMMVRKFRQKHGSDQLRGFASNITVVPLIRESSLKAAEDIKLQILSTILSGGATLGTDNGQMALRCAKEEEHYKVLVELVKNGADTVSLSMYDGDTPIHAALVIVLEKEKSNFLLEFLLEKYFKDPDSYQHLDPEQLDVNDECIFHHIAKTKFTPQVLKLTEMLCEKGNISANYRDKANKLPAHYFTKKNDRRLQYFRMAQSRPPSKKQISEEEPPKKTEEDQKDEMEDLYNLRRPADSQTSPKSGAIEVVKLESEKEKRKKHIEELIKLLPDSRHSIFNTDNSQRRPPIPQNEHIDEYAENYDKNSKHAELRSGPDIQGRMNDKTPNDESKPIHKETALDLNDASETNIPDSQFEDTLEEKTCVPASELDESIEDEFVDAVEDLSEIPTHMKKDIVVEVCPEETQSAVNDVPEDETVRDETATCSRQENNGINLNRNNNADDEAIEAMGEVDSDDDDNNDYGEEEEEDDEDYEINVQVFDNLEWEVECTAEVWKTLRDKHVLPDLKRRIVRKVQLLASGDWTPVLCKKLKHVPASINLFEAKFSKGRRIIWELAIAFSPRLSETAERRLLGNVGELTQAVIGGRIYSEIIRVWEIVLDHDKIHRSVQRIKKSHQRGETCIIQKKLRGMKVDADQINTSKTKRYPMLFAEEDISENELQKQHQEMQRFFPPASSNDTEYHILKFYSFSSALVSHVLQNIETKVDFPFRVTDLEHAIINLKSKAPILLLGRSGTGKTTCCLYRLWSKFHSYWTIAKESGPLLPRALEFVHQEVGDSSSDGDLATSEEGSGDDIVADDDMIPTASARECRSDGQDVSEDVTGIHYDHLHQIFITKNAVLSSEVQKNFRDLSHADDLMKERVQHEEEVLPSRLQDVQDFAYPLFLTSRQLLLMLDASLEPPHFFERRDDGSLKVDIAGWTDLDGPLSFLPMLDDDSDVEDEGKQYDEDEDDDMDGPAASARGKKLKVDPRREITYIVFVDEIWPKIQKKDGNFHPSLVWMEIMSFIKGSFEALSKRSGHLEKKDYVSLGRKRAPNFSGERDSIYRVFKRYEHFKKQNSLFDETDLVHDVFNRLRKQQTPDWVVHQVFVDETQDFTQAELCLLIRLCQNPNELFLTGDTAQSIMRGISFRFNDLRSLFYHAKQSMRALGKTSAVEVPEKVYQLTHNYRSHAGILSLATSVLELMVKFFPESFDRLQPDQGLFHGPKPILLESCSFGDLAVLLKGNKRKTSRIEFGAHQAILVVNDAARDSIPEELRLGLVLTIYEAKGLEFDDVLLYNFFKDSQASKEWRVVTSYLEEQATNQNEPIQSYNNLVEIDHEILSAKGRPRPLEFQPQQHKVLNSELKHLYTALTRARVNVWMFDEDLDKRAPMFEYFKARKLVKSMKVEEINETSLAETVFAEKSSPSDWIKRGEDFMRHSLYTVAAKCFAMGGQRDRQKVALAHGQALLAARMKDSPKQMRDEFVRAAELYLECNKPAKAALCLQNAKERELAADLFEKLGQYEKAGDIYRRMKLPIASSKCYEQLGNYNKAVEVLFKSEHYDMAIDALKRYKMHIKNFEEKGEHIPQHLLDNSPKGYTEDKMSHRAADMYHRLNNKDRMLAAVDRLENVQDKVVFLKNRNYIREAAKTYVDNNEWESAVNLMLIHGFVDEAVDIARKSLQDDIIAHTLLVACRRSMSKVNKNGHDENLEEIPKESLRQNLDEVGKLYESKHDNDHVGEVAVLQARLCYDFESVKRGWKAFLNSKPFPNEPGLLECCDLLVQSGDHGNIEVIQLIVRGIKYLFRVCKTFQDNSNKSDRNKIMKYYQFYGLEYSSQDKLVIHPKLKPVFLQMSHSLKIDKKKVEVEVDKIKAHDSIVDYLLQRGALWLEKVQDLLENIREERLECGYHVVGVECDETGNVDNPCKRIHSTTTQESFRQLLDIDLLMIEFEKVVMDGMSDLTQKNDVSMKSLVDRLNLEDKDPCVRYKACLHLWNDLMPAAGHPFFIHTDSRKLMDYIRKNNQVVTHFKNYLVGRWDMFTSGRNIFDSKAVKETDMYLVLQFGYYLFGLDAGKIKLSQSPIKEITTLENDLDREVASKQSLYKERNSFTLMMDKDEKGKIFVTCAARRFVDALQYLTSSSPNPVEAVMKFSKFQIQLSKRKDPMGKFYPELKHYLLWLEFFTSLSIMIIAKLKTENFADFTFFFPNNYHALLHFIEASFPSSAFPVEETVAWWEPASHKKMKFMDLLSERLKGFTFVISGHAQIVKILDKILGRCSKEIKDLALLERFLILGMTMICNIGQAVPVESELSLLSTLSHIELPDGASDRIKHAICLVKKCTGISGIAKVLIDLLDKRQQKESLMVCRWRLGKKSRIEKVPFQDYKNLQDSFYNMKTLLAMQASHVITEPMKMDETLEELQDEEEIQKGMRDKQAQLEEDWLKKKTEAATFIQRTFKAFLDGKKKKCEKETGTDTRSDVHAIFENRKIDDKMCGVCGYSFSNKVKNILDAKESMLVGGQSVLNTGKAEEPWAQPLQTTFEGGHVSAYTKVDVVSATSTDMLLQKVKNNHLEDSEHIKKYQDLNKFKVKYIEEIEPNHRMVRQFLDNPDYKLSDYNFVRKHYGKEVMHIERLKSACLNLEKELNLLMSRATWNEMQAFLIESKIPLLMQTFESIEPYVRDDHLRWRQEKDRKSIKKPIYDVVGDDDQLEDEAECIEELVQDLEPRIKPKYKTWVYYNKRK